MPGGNRYPSETEEEVLAETLRSLEELIKEVDQPAAHVEAEPGNAAVPDQPPREESGAPAAIEHSLPPNTAGAARPRAAAVPEPEIEHSLPPQPRSEILTDGRRDRVNSRPGRKDRPIHHGLLELELPALQPVEMINDLDDSPAPETRADAGEPTANSAEPPLTLDAREPAAAPPAPNPGAPNADADGDFPVLEQVAVLPTHRRPGTTAGRRQRDAPTDHPAVAPSALAQLTDTAVARLSTELRRATGHELDNHTQSQIRQMLRSALAEWAQRLAQRLNNGRPPVD
jgi:hypothetical protein